MPWTFLHTYILSYLLSLPWFTLMSYFTLMNLTHEWSPHNTFAGENEPHVYTVKLRVSNAFSIDLCCGLLVSPVHSATYGSCSPDPFQPFYVYCTRHQLWYCTRRHKIGVRLLPMNTLPNHFWSTSMWADVWPWVYLFTYLGLDEYLVYSNVRQHSNMF